MGDLYPRSVQGQLTWLIGTLVSKWPLTRKRLAGERSGLPFVDTSNTRSTFDLNMFKVVLGPINVLISKWTITRQRMFIDCFV